jgi:2'-5' RNA ligase
MNDQLRLDLNDDDPHTWRRSKFPERIFLGVRPDAAAAILAKETARQLRAASGLRGELLRRRRLHVTLQHIGDYKRLKSNILFAADPVGAAISMPPFEVVFDGAESFPAPLRHTRSRNIQRCWEAIAPQPITSLRWTVREFLLIHSERGLTKNNILGPWPLHSW